MWELYWQTALMFCVALPFPIFILCFSITCCVLWEKDGWKIVVKDWHWSVFVFSIIVGLTVASILWPISLPVLFTTAIYLRMKE
jgi:magnesium-transporting ATPase (P-type)